MFRTARQRKAVMAVALAIAGLGAFDAAAQETAEVEDRKLVVACAPPVQEDGNRTLSCALRVPGFAEFRNVIARIGGESTNLETRFEPFDPTTDGSTTAYLIQTVPKARRATLAQMADAVASIADPREGRRRFNTYMFAGDLTSVADSGVSRDEFVRQLVAITPADAAAPIHLYKSVEAAVKALADETGARKSLVLLADGTSDDGDATADEVIALARDAGVVIHVLGYYDDARQRSKFEALSRLAKETGGHSAEVKRGAGAKNDFTKEIVKPSFLTDVVENGGAVTIELAGPGGARNIEFTAELADGTTLNGETAVDIPAAATTATAPPQPVEAPKPTPAAEPEPVDTEGGFGIWLVVIALGALAGLGMLAYTVYGRDLLQFVRWWFESAARNERVPTKIAAPDQPPAALPAPPVEEPKTVRLGKPSRKRAPEQKQKSPVYGWLETLDGEDAARHPLRTTNVRVGRHRDNDICLLNDSISRRHALLHYDPVTRRFTITDLGAGNGVIVNASRTKSRELKDGDTVELGEVRLRFHAEPEFA